MTEQQRRGGAAAGLRRPAVEGLEVRRLLSGLVVHSGPPVRASPGVEATFRASFDDPGQPLPHAVIDWGDGTTTAVDVFAVVQFAPGGTGDSDRLTAGHSYAAFGTYAITLTLSDAGGQTAVVTDTATVAGLVAQPAGVRGTAGIGLAATTPVAYVTTADPAARASDLAATIAWGDGTTSAGTFASAVHFDAPPPPGGPVSFIVEGGHVYRTPGAYAVHVAITDAAGHAASAVDAATVAREALRTTGLAITARAGASTGPIAVAAVADSIPETTDGPGAYLHATIAWGDGTTSAGTFAPGAGVAPGVRTPGRLYGPFVVMGAHRYGRAGSYMIHVGLASAAGTTALTTSSATVAAAAIVPAHRPGGAAAPPPHSWLARGTGAHAATQGRAWTRRHP